TTIATRLIHEGECALMIAHACGFSVYVVPRMPRLICLLVYCAILVLSAAPVRAGAKEDVQELLAKTILQPDQTLSEVQNFRASRIPPLPQPATVAAWEEIVPSLRAQTLTNTVYRGAADQWRKSPLSVEWLETIPGGPGYHIRKLRYEAVPGMWIPA